MGELVEGVDLASRGEGGWIVRHAYEPTAKAGAGVGETAPGTRRHGGGRDLTDRKGEGNGNQLVTAYTLLRYAR
ncbi:hypothetical protein GCM10020367_30060 [Streptomyces sannanensis]|uniref:Uncharacterized protein n=1 Tax=Streptomyces sannanensis TaxID=285536 RepID=A0ABP6SBU4_9ACTN